MGKLTASSPGPIGKHLCFPDYEAKEVEESALPLPVWILLSMPQFSSFTFSFPLTLLFYSKNLSQLETLLYYVLIHSLAAPQEHKPQEGRIFGLSLKRARTRATWSTVFLSLEDHKNRPPAVSLPSSLHLLGPASIQSLGD